MLETDTQRNAAKAENQTQIAVGLNAEVAPTEPGPQRRALTFLVLAIILIVGAWLRLAGGNWDEDQHLNVDDYYVARVATKRISLPPNSTLSLLLDPQKSPLNARANGEFYVYGTLPVYLVRGVSSVVYAVTNDPHHTNVNGILSIGRNLAAITDLFTVLLVFLIGRRLWSATLGLVAAAFYSFGVLPVQMSHFFLCDDFAATFMTAALFFSIVYLESRRPRTMLAAGLCVGLAMACKLSAAPTILVPLLSIALVMRASRGQEKVWRRGLVAAALVVGAAIVALFLTDPFAILDAPTYARVLIEQAAIQSGDVDQWFSRKYVGTWPVLQPLGQLVLLGVGPLVGVAGIIGAAIIGSRARLGRYQGELLLLWGALVYFASIAFVELKWVRYLLPLVPYMALFATAFCAWAWAAAAKRSWSVAAAGAAPAVLIASAVVGAFAVSSIFTSQNTQVYASRWMYKNVPLGSSIGFERTAIDMPLSLPDHPRPFDEYKLVDMDPLADHPSQEVADILYSQLSKSDYLILDSTQAMGTVPRLPWRYPVQIRYYDLLNSGQLGFTMVVRATSYPKIFGLQFPDDGGWVDPSFMDSSHPPINVYKKEHTLSKEEWTALFAEAVKQPSVASRRPPQ